VSVTPQVKNQNGKLTIVFQVDEGERDIVESLKIEGNKSFSEEQLAPKGLNLEPGKPYSQDLLNRDRDRIVATYLDHGFLTMAFRAKVTQPKNNPHQIQVIYSIEEGPQVYTSSLAQLGAPGTRPEIVARNANIKTGKPLSETALLQGESNLYTLGIFDWTSVDTREPITDQSQADVLVKMHEAPKNTITYGVGFEVTNRGGSIPSGTVALPGLPPVGLPQNFQTSQQTFWGPRGSIQYRRNNFRGRAETVTIGGFAGRLDQRADASWVNPNFWNGGWSSTVTLSGERNSENPIFTSQLGNAGIQFQHFLDAKKTKSVYVRYNLSHTKLTNLLVPQLVLPEDQNVRLSTVSGSYSRDTRDNVLDAHKGIYQSFEIGINPSALGSNTNFARFLGQVAYYKPVFGNATVWANSIRLGLEQSFAGAHIPLSESFFSGGGSTLRGFPLNGAGPQRLVPVCGNAADPSTCSQISVPVGGPQLLILNSELRFPLGLMKNLGGAAFYDGGNVFSKIGFGSFTSDYTNSIGFGLRYSTPVGPVRIDIGHLVNNVPGVKATQLFITLGQAF
jgi:outer membrane protein assembly factor BamA